MEFLCSALVSYYDNRGTGNGSIRVESGKKKRSHEGSDTMAIRFGFLMENFFVKLSSQVTGLVFPYKSLYFLRLKTNGKFSGNFFGLDIRGGIEPVCCVFTVIKFFSY